VRFVELALQAERASDLRLEFEQVVGVATGLRLRQDETL